jgi:hypothetical protein
MSRLVPEAYPKNQTVKLALIQKRPPQMGCACLSRALPAGQCSNFAPQCRSWANHDRRTEPTAPPDAMQADMFRRRTNGTAEIDRYRACALGERAAVRTDFFKRMSKLVGPALATALFTLILFALVNQNQVRNAAATTAL